MMMYAIDIERNDVVNDQQIDDDRDIMDGYDDHIRNIIVIMDNNNDNDDITQART